MSGVGLGLALGAAFALGAAYGIGRGMVAQLAILAYIVMAMTLVLR